MIHSIYVVKNPAGVLLFGRDYRNNEIKEVITGFFTAIKNFISEAMNETCKERMEIRLDHSIISLKTISELNVDVVIIVDLKDEKLLEGLFAELSGILRENAHLFAKWDGLINKFKMLGKAFDDVILKSNQSDDLLSLLTGQGRAKV